MIDISNVSKDEALHLANLVNQLAISDRLVRGLTDAGIDFSAYHKESTDAARVWLTKFCTEIADKLRADDVVATAEKLKSTKELATKVKSKTPKKVSK